MAFAHAVHNLLVIEERDSIDGELLMSRIKGVEFEGLTGAVKFSENGDRDLDGGEIWASEASRKKGYCCRSTHRSTQSFTSWLARLSSILQSSSRSSTTRGVKRRGPQLASSR